MLEINNKYFVLFGGGRWGRIVLIELNKISKNKIKWITKHNYEQNKEWLLQNKSTNIIIQKTVSKNVLMKSSAVFLINSPADRLSFIDKNMYEGIDLFLEKPIALNFNKARKLKKAADFSSSLVSINLEFYFDEVFPKIASQINQIKISKIDFLWEDAITTNPSRYQKRADIETPIALDQFPHIWCVLNVLGIKTGEMELEKVQYCKNSNVLISLSSKICRTQITMSRRGKLRQRKIKINDNIIIDFSNENVIFKNPSSNQYMQYQYEHGNVKRSLNAFLKSINSRKNQVNSLEKNMDMLKISYNIQEKIDKKIIKLLLPNILKISMNNSYLFNACEDYFLPRYRHHEKKSLSIGSAHYHEKLINYAQSNLNKFHLKNNYLKKL